VIWVSAWYSGNMLISLSGMHGYYLDGWLSADR